MGDRELYSFVSGTRYVSVASGDWHLSLCELPSDEVITLQGGLGGGNDSEHCSEEEAVDAEPRRCFG